jgi:adenylate kinase family enzyme
MRRVLVIGPGGAGKSLFATRLGQLLNIEVLHLDKFYWRPGWIETPKAEWSRTVDDLLRRDSWIMDGNYSATLDVRLEACDTVIFLDLSRTVCLWRVLKRRIMYREGRRPDMAEGCPEKFNLEFISWSWNYSSRSRPKVVRMLETNAQRKNVVWLRSRADVERFLVHTVSEPGAVATGSSLD